MNRQPRPVVRSIADRERCSIGRISVLKNFGNLVLVGASALMGVGALFVSARSSDPVGYLGGLGMFAFCVLFAFLLVKLSTGQRE